MRKFVQWHVLVGCLLFCVNAQAATLVINGSGKLTGATGVLVGGSLYDVAFVEGTCASVYGTCAAGFFDLSVATAVLAAEALLDQVFIGSFDDDSTRTFGCDASQCNALTPYDRGSAVNIFKTRNYSLGLGGDLVGSSIYQVDQDSSLDALHVWARWSPNPTVPTPEPSSVMLLGFGLLAMVKGGLFRTRR